MGHQQIKVTWNDKERTLEQWGNYFNMRRSQMDYWRRKLGGEWIEAFEKMEAMRNEAEKERVAEIIRNDRLFHIAMNALPAKRMTCNNKIM